MPKYDFETNCRAIWLFSYWLTFRASRIQWPLSSFRQWCDKFERDLESLFGAALATKHGVYDNAAAERRQFGS
jgi:hypothetical protein